MLMQTNSYLVHAEHRDAHIALMRRFRRVLSRLGCDDFEVYEQMSTDWRTLRPVARCVQILRFRDRQHYQAVREAEQSDPEAQQLVGEFCELVRFPRQQARGLVAIGHYGSLLPPPVGSGDAAHQPHPGEEGPLASLGLGSADRQGPVASRDFGAIDVNPDAERDIEKDLRGEPPPDGGKDRPTDPEP